MRYYVMEEFGNVSLPTVPKGEDAEVVISSELERFSEIDFDPHGELVSDRLKLLLERYMPKYDFQPVVFLDTKKQAQMVFWRFTPPDFDGYKAEFRNDGVISHISFLSDDFPIVFTARSPRGVRSVVVRMAVAESTLRRSILGLKFTKVLDYNEGQAL